MPIDAAIWDYDGTLVNSAIKNMEINKQIIAVVAPHLSGENLSEYLQSQEAYNYANHASKNWQELYTKFYGLTEKEMLTAGKLWTEYQLRDNTPVNFFPQIKETILKITIPQGICSQNSTRNIKDVLKNEELLHKFDAVIGYDGIPEEKQKPEAYGGIQCISELFENVENKHFLYIGDHEADVFFTHNIAENLSPSSSIKAVAVSYSGALLNSWVKQPDFVLNTPNDLLKILASFS